MFSATTSDAAPPEPGLRRGGDALPGLVSGLDITLTSHIEDVEAIWRQLAAGSVESPGQSYDFIRLWVADRKIPVADQHYLVARLAGQPLALLPLHRKRVWGLRVFTWFPGANANCYAPIADYERLAALGREGRAALWQAMLGRLQGADAVYLRSVPAEIGGHSDLFDELGDQLPIETLYRSQYSSWQECDRLQRSRSRRKHDRQQGERLAALGTVDFEEMGGGQDMERAIKTLFRQRSARFRAMGIRDLFVLDQLTGFYLAAAAPGSGLDVRLHILRLDGQIVAMRYNIVHGERMFCLISSMSDDPAIQAGSPGKQCLLRVMQAVFEEGIAVFDMGSGFTDEKRHWCNVQIPLHNHYVGLTLRGGIAVTAHRLIQRLRAAIKANGQLRRIVRSLRLAFARKDASAPLD